MSLLPDAVPQEKQILMQHLGEDIDSALNPHDGDRTNGFILITHPFDTSGEHCVHISNMNRDDAILVLKELLARWEGSPGQVTTRRQ